MQLTAVNAQTKGYEGAYVGTEIDAGSSKTYVGKTVVQELYNKYGASKQMGKATISVVPEGSSDASNLEEITGGSISIYTTDFELNGRVQISGGTIDWEDIIPNVPSINLTAEGDTTLAPGGTVQLSAEFRKMNETTLNWSVSTTSNITVATVDSNGLVTVNSNAEDGQTATITATGNGVTSNSIIITVQDLPTVSKYRTLTQNSLTGAVVVNADANETIYDDNNKPVIIPAGFGIASDSGTKIEEGIVIEDAFSSGDNAAKKGSQFVWVPVDTIVKYNSNYVGSDQQKSLANADSSLEKEGANSGIIKLSRYDFGTRVDATSISTLIPKGAQDEIKRRRFLFHRE